MLGEKETRSNVEGVGSGVNEDAHIVLKEPSYSTVAEITDRRFDTCAPKILYAANVASFFKKFLLPYADHFRSKGWRVDALSKGFYDSAESEYSHRFDHLWEVDWARKPHKLRSAGNIVQQIRAIADKGQYDLIHVHTPVAAMVTRYALRNRHRRTNTKVLYTAHGFHFFPGAPKVSGAVIKRLETVASGWTDYLIVMNQEDFAAARSLKKIPEDRIVYMPGIGIDLNRYNSEISSREETRFELGISADEALLLCVAEFIPRKRQSDLLHALKHLGDARVKVAFAGDGETLRMVKELAQRNGLSDQAIFLGLRRDVPRLLKAADCCILPSSQEGLPRSVMESMCSGVPVIATDIRGTRELLENGVGVLYPVGDHTALAKAIGDFMHDREASKQRARHGIERVQKYDLQTVIQMHEDVYARALGVNREDILPGLPKQEGYLL